MIDLIEPAVMYFHRKAWERANREDLLLHLVEDTTPVSDVAGELVRTILFVDLSSFTPLTEVMGDAVAAQVEADSGASPGDSRPGRLKGKPSGRSAQVVPPLR